MALTVAELQVVIDAQAKAFSSEIKKAETRLKGFEKTGNRATRSISGGFSKLKAVAGPALAALGLGAAAAAFSSAARSASQFIDTIGKTADQLGVTTGFLQEFRVAATLTGGDVAGADKAIERLTRGLGDAATGTGPVVRAFQELGINAATIGDLGTDEVLDLIADGLQNVEGAARKNAIAFQLFGRSGGFLINTLKDGSDGLREFRMIARETGQVIDDSLIRRAEMLNDRFDLANMRIRNSTLPLLIDLQEGLTLAAEAAVGVLNAAAGLSDDPIITDATIANQSALTRELVTNEQAIADLSLRIERLPTIGSEQSIRTLKEEIRVLRLRNLDLQDGITGIIIQRQEAIRLAEAVDDVATSAGNVPTFELVTAEQFALVGDARNVEINRLREAFFRQEELNKIREEALGDELQAIADAKTAEADKDRVALDAINEKIRKEEELASLRITASETLIELENRLAREETIMGDPLRGRQADIEDQIASAEAAARLTTDPGAQAAAATAIGILTERRAEITMRINDLERANVSLAELIQARSTALLATDRQRAITLQEQLDLLLAQDLPLEEQQQRLRDILSGDAPGGMMGGGNIERLAQGFSDAIFSGLSGGLDDFGTGLLDTVIMATSDGTKTGFEEAQKFVTGSLSKGIRAASGALGGLFDDGGAEGGGLFGQLSGFIESEKGQGFLNSAVNFGARAIQGFRQGAETEATAAGDIASAVTSVARVRGIVAGPTTLAVAQVDRAIGDAFIETNFILRRIEENTRGTATNTSDTGTGSVPTGGTSEATQALANEGPSIV